MNNEEWQNHWEEYYSSNDDPNLPPCEVFMKTMKKLKPGRALDLGAGHGSEAFWLARKGWDVTAIDFSKSAVETINRMARDKALSVKGKKADILEYQSSATYDLVYMCYIHSKGKDRKRMLSNAASALKPGGMLVYIGMAGEFDEPENFNREIFAPEAVVIEDMGDLSVEFSETSKRMISFSAEESHEKNIVLVAARKNRP